MRAVAKRLPSQEECWHSFWTKMATAWASLSPEIQRECVVEAALMNGVITERRLLLGTPT